MAASIPGDTAANNAANPSAGAFVTFSLLSGPKGSALGGRTLAWDANNHPVYTADSSNLSTGALSTGLGFGATQVIGPTAPASIVLAGFNDDYVPGVTKPDGSASANSTIMHIGGGRSNADGSPNPYTAGWGIGGAGNGASRDAGAGPVYTGFATKMVTAAAGVAAGAAIETGFTNRSGVALVTGQSAFGSSTTASAAVA